MYLYADVILVNFISMNLLSPDLLFSGAVSS